jgi:hypothetical protein
MQNSTLAKNWITLAVTALGISGLFTILLIIARTSTHKYFAEHDLFNASLIVHVNLGVLVWLLSSFAAFSGSQKKIPFYLALAGTVLIIASPFISYGTGYQNNYIPIFDNTIFKAGIALFLAAITLVCIENPKNPVAALILLAFGCFIASYIGIKDKTSSHYLYETMFWGGGHVLQFAYVQLMITAWLVLSKPYPYPRFLWIPFILALISSAFIYFSYPVESAEYTNMFTKQMYWFSAAGVVLVLPFIRTRSLAVIFSILLFILGGSLGQMIGEVSTTIIPAHYHGSVMAVTIALMGLAYERLNIKPNKWQITIYFIGQTIHVICMAVMGFHGASRKTPGDMGEHTAKIWGQIMDTGGALVLIGGIMFVVIILRALRQQRALS